MESTAMRIWRRLGPACPSVSVSAILRARHPGKTTLPWLQILLRWNGYGLGPVNLSSPPRSSATESTECHPFRRWIASLRATPVSVNRFGSLHHHAATQHLHFRVVTHQKDHHPCHNRTGRQHNKAERCFASRIFDPANGIWADEAPETADRIYQCDAASGSGAGKKAGREGPESGYSRIVCHHADGDSNSRQS